MEHAIANLCDAYDNLIVKLVLIKINVVVIVILVFRINVHEIIKVCVFVEAEIIKCIFKYVDLVGVRGLVN